MSHVAKWKAKLKGNLLKKAKNKIRFLIIKYLYLNVYYIFPELRKVLMKEGLQGAILFLERKPFLYKFAAIRFLIELYQYALVEDSRQVPNREDKVFIIHFCSWGSGYANKIIHYMLPSLLAEGNLPALSQQYKVILSIHCDEGTAKVIENAEVGKRIQGYATLEINKIPEKVMTVFKESVSYPNVGILKYINRANDGLKYLLLGTLQTLILNQALRDKAIISFLMPDVILSDFFFSYALEKMQDKKLVATSTFRTDDFNIASELNKFYKNNDPCVLSLSGEDIVRLQIENMHEQDALKIVSPQTKGYTASPRMIFKSKTGLVLRALQYHPILLNCAKVGQNVNPDYFPIDELVLKFVLTEDEPYEQQVWLCSDANKMSIMELSGDEHRLTKEDKSKATCLDYEHLLEAVILMIKASSGILNNKLNRFFIQNKLEFLTKTAYHHVDEIVDDELFVKDLYKQVEY